MSELDLTPRDDSEGRSPRRRGSMRNAVVLGTLALVLGFVLYQALSSARVFFYNVDEAIEQQDELGDRTFRMQGTVVSDERVDPSGAIVFTVAFRGASAEVHHVGDEPSGLFGNGEKVVVEGRWDGDVFRSHQVLVKHSEQYVEDNPERLEYELDESDK